MINVIIIFQVLTAAGIPASGPISSLSDYWSENQKRLFNNVDSGSKIFHLQQDLVVSSTIQVRSEALTLLGNNTSLLSSRDISSDSDHHIFSQNQDLSSTKHATSEQQCNGRAAASQFMFCVWNSTFSVKGVHVNCNSGRNGICSISGSHVQFSSSTISSNGHSSPLMVRMLDAEGCESSSCISFLGVTHLSKTCSLPPLVGVLPSSTILSSAPNSHVDGRSLDNSPGVSVVGTGLEFGSMSFSAGTGPLFSFGLSEELSLPDIAHSLRVETTLIGSSLVNVTSRKVETRKGLLFGGEVTQRVIGSEIHQSTNHDSGTGMLDVNLGGNVRCVNTSFTECRREGNTDPSFVNKNITSSVIGRQEFNHTSTATLVSYSLCTFKNMAFSAPTSEIGGSAIYLKGSPASLAVKDCFFQSCRVTESYHYGGAICMWGDYFYRPYLRLERSSFSKCKAVGAYDCFGGCVFVDTTQDVVITDSFFENSTAMFEGGVSLLYVSESVFSNCAFVLCSSENRGGAVCVYQSETDSMKHVQFRECSSTKWPDSRDVSFFTHTSAQVADGQVEYCDSTSGNPNVYLMYYILDLSSLVPQIKSPPTITHIDIQFDEDQELATVTVTASKSIGGTMGILLDGLIVPRLIHVVFGATNKPSQTGTAVVLSGPNGILPKAEYTELNNTVSSSLFPTITILGCSCSLKDDTSSLIVVRGWCLEKGDYVMKFKEGQDGEEKELSLTWESAGALHGSTPFYPSDAEGRLEWRTEYEVTDVVKMSGNVGISIPFSRIIKFTTPAEPIRITEANCTLGGEKEKAGVVEFGGVGLSSGLGYTLKVQKEENGVASGAVIDLKGTLSAESESGSFSHTESIFGASSPLLSFGETYLVVGIVVGGEDGVVNQNVRFSVPGEPGRLTKMTASKFTDAEKTEIELSFETRALKASTSYSMLLQSIAGEGETRHEKTLVLTTDTDGVIPAFAVILYPIAEDEAERKGQLEFGTEYEVKQIQKGSTEIHFETATTTFSTPSEPIRIEEANCTLGGEKEKAGVVEFGGVGLSSGKGYTLKVKKVESEGVVSGEEIELTGTLSSTSESGSFSHTESISIFVCIVSFCHRLGRNTLLQNPEIFPKTRH
ncbi:hypothetical protein BLNAU_16474 [Blattamonas nauphoetae]|uniref:Uncharacterized protein n=1 Tax=Blattamonas nauphoetae TaxID=2049346 RepID=A0ABQ9XB67_9EUKA|nr:hypothetical protein BLNAU_16474 [Blattamonas nauphoetae]